jgi:DNA-binding MarR family transcriptional regulator
MEKYIVHIDYLMLAFLKKHPRTSVGDLSRGIKTNRTRVSTRLKRFIESGYVSSDINPKNRVERLCTLTDKGMQLVDSLEGLATPPAGD